MCITDFFKCVALHMMSRPSFMTVPMSDQHNIVVAETLREFLSIGYFVGWFSLEQLAYQESWAIGYFTKPDADSWPEKEKELRLIRDALSVEYIPLTPKRIQELREKYLSLLLPSESIPSGS